MYSQRITNLQFTIVLLYPARGWKCQYTICHHHSIYCQQWHRVRLLHKHLLHLKFLVLHSMSKGSNASTWRNSSRLKARKRKLSWKKVKQKKIPFNCLIFTLCLYEKKDFQCRKVLSIQYSIDNWPQIDYFILYVLLGEKMFYLISCSGPLAKALEPGGSVQYHSCS